MSTVALTNIKKIIVFKRLHLLKTASRQNRFLDFTNLAPMCFHTYEYMKCTLLIFFLVWNRASRLDFSDLAKNSQIWHCFGVFEKNHYFELFLGPAKVSRPLAILEEGAWSEKPSKNWIGGSGRPTVCRWNVYFSRFWCRILMACAFKAVWADFWLGRARTS